MIRTEQRGIPNLNRVIGRLPWKWRLGEIRGSWLCKLGHLPHQLGLSMPTEFDPDVFVGDQWRAPL
jgi:hypothetical protein